MSPKVALSIRNLRKSAPYEQALRAAGLDPITITPEHPVSLDGFSGLVLAGGSDVAPAFYGQAMNGSEDIDTERDQFEKDLLENALAADLPVLAICRGVQMLNVVHGGSLIQHLPQAELHDRYDKEWESGKHPVAHQVSVNPGTHLAGIIGAGPHDVNSRHHQAADSIGKDLLVSAVSSDGVIEGLERSDRKFVIGVQWHPEDRHLVSDSDRRLFAAFADAVQNAFT